MKRPPAHDIPTSDVSTGYVPELLAGLFGAVLVFSILTIIFVAYSEGYMPTFANTIKVVLSPGARLLVAFEETDGTFTIDFDSDGNRKLRVIADTPDSTDRNGVIYEERFESYAIDPVSDARVPDYRRTWPRE